jgi:hypothetical protein
MQYKPAEIEKKWQEKWDAEKAFEPKEDKSLPKKYMGQRFGLIVFLQILAWRFVKPMVHSWEQH